MPVPGWDAAIGLRNGGANAGAARAGIDPAGAVDGLMLWPLDMDAAGLPTPHLAAAIQGGTAGEGRPDIPALSRQIAASVAQLGDGAVEITLAPEELGRLRVRVTHHDGGTLVTLGFERPDIAEAARRQGGLLLHDLQDSGFADAQLEFDDTPHPGRDDRRYRDAPEPVGATEREPSGLPGMAVIATLGHRHPPGIGRHLDMLM